MGTPKCRCCKMLLEREVDFWGVGTWHFPSRCPYACPREGQMVDLDAETVEVVEDSE